MCSGSWSRTARTRTCSGTPADFVIGVEESHGILTTPQIRDKDAGGAALLLAELALDQKRRGQTVLDYVDRLAREFGYFHNEGIPVFMTGVQGKQQMARMLDRLRAAPPQGDRRLAGDALRGPARRRGPIRTAQGRDRRRLAQRAGLPLRRAGAGRPAAQRHGAEGEDLPGSVFAALPCRGRRPRPGGGRVRMWTNGRSAWAKRSCARRWR